MYGLIVGRKIHNEGGEKRYFNGMHTIRDKCVYKKNNKEIMKIILQ
jgi:hypothetical protein